MSIKVTISPLGPLRDGIAIDGTFTIIPSKVAVEFEDEAAHDAAKLGLLSKQGPLYEATMEAEKLFSTTKVLPNVSEDDVKSAKLSITANQKDAFFILLGMQVQTSSYYVKQEPAPERGSESGPICWQLRKEDFVKLVETFSHLNMTKDQIALMVALPAVRKLMIPMQETKADKGFRQLDISKNKIAEVLEVISKHHLNEYQLDKLLKFAVNDVNGLESALSNLEKYGYPEKPYSASLLEYCGYTYEPKELVSQPSVTQDE